MTESPTISILVQAGAVGISFLLIWVVYKLVSNHDAHSLEALNRNTDAFLKISEAMQRLTDKIDSLK